MLRGLVLAIRSRIASIASDGPRSVAGSTAILSDGEPGMNRQHAVGLNRR
jgi:hypothetical protein